MGIDLENKIHIKDKNMVKIFCKIGYLICIMLVLSNCGPRIPKLPLLDTTTFVISDPRDFNCFINHQGPGVPTTKISLFIFTK